MNFNDAIFHENKYRIKKFSSSDGCAILAGRDGVSNDYLTFKIGQPNDLWFHVKGESGSHVILKCTDVKKTLPLTSQREAASVAAWYSKMRKGGKVPVSVCRVKDISKPKGAAPGLVKVRKVKTLMVTPELPGD